MGGTILMLEDMHCAFQSDAPPCARVAEFNIWNLGNGTQTLSCKAHIGDLLGLGENRIMPLNEGG
jgi:hypothetical protein